MSRLAGYVVERFPPVVFVPAIGLLATAAWAPSISHSLSTFAQAVALMTLLVGEFRVWDDLEDRDLDRQRHPGRVMAAGPATPFWCLAAVLFAAAATMLAATPAAVAGLAALHAGMFWAYRRLRPGVTDRVWRYGVLPLKYPAFVVLVSVALGEVSPMAVAVAGGLSYAGACAYEIRSDAPNHVEVVR
jgi:4-hydroxybenzoate polyprenyltransferase